MDLEQHLEGYQSLRYLHYLRYLNDCAPDADLVMLSDVRDVVFQDDPFTRPIRGDLELFLEADGVTLRNSGWDWIRSLYGPNELNRIGDQPMSCSGTTIGTRKGIVKYLEAMTAEILRHERPLRWRDQGIHNYLLWNKHFDPVSLFRNGCGRVLTLGAESGIDVDTTGRVLNRDRTVPAVIHQYDRHSAITEMIWKKFA